MPNWCWTSYVAVGDKKDIRDLYKKMKSLEDSENPLSKTDSAILGWEIS